MLSIDVYVFDKLMNFNDYIYEDGLKAVKPDAVNFIR